MVLGLGLGFNDDAEERRDWGRQHHVRWTGAELQEMKKKIRRGKKGKRR